MKKLLILITVFTFISCGVIKKDKRSVNTETTSDLNASKTDKSHEVGGSVILRPFDPTKGIVYGKDTIYNATIETHYYDRVKVVTDTIHKRETQVIEVDIKQKETDNTAIYNKFMWLIIILFVIALAYYHFTKPKVS